MVNKDEQFSKVLSLSYNHLPNHLRPCFLYMGVFPEDYEIRGSRLVRLWVAEGFLKPISGKSMEEAGDAYLKALVDRNLISVRRKETNGIAKSYSIHDLLRDLCMRKASEEKFLYVRNPQVHDLPEDTAYLRRVTAHPSYLIQFIHKSTVPLAHVRSVLLTGYEPAEILCPLISRLRLLKVLDIFGVYFFDFPEEVLQLNNLRYLVFKCRSPPPFSISTLCNLETIILQTRETLWERETILKVLEMPRLRHIKFKAKFTFFKHPNGKAFALQENLQCLTTVEIINIGFVQLLRSVPNLKKLGVYCFYMVDFDIDLSFLLKLETFKCSSYIRSNILSSLTFIFPPSLKKLTMNECSIPPELLNKIGNLPNLQVLKLRDSRFESPNWEPVEGEFSQLRFLLLEKLWDSLNLVADERNFPRLECLVIRHCYQLGEIPIGIGEISTLETIEVHACSKAAVASARKIQEEQLELGNCGLQIRISH